MAANPNPAPRRNRYRKLALVERTIIPISTHPIAPAIVWPPVEGDTEHCAACGHAIGEHVVLSRGGMRAHLILQDRNGFRDEKRIVHYTPAQLAEKQRAELEARNAPKPVETAPVVRGTRSSVERWRKFEDKMYAEHPRAAWIVLCARQEALEGKHEQAAKTVALFRREVVRENAGRREAWQDYADATDTRRWMA